MKNVLMNKPSPDLLQKTPDEASKKLASIIAVSGKADELPGEAQDDLTDQTQVCTVSLSNH